MNQTETININTLLNIQVPVPASTLQTWQQYLAKDTDPKLYTYTQKSQIEIAEKFYNLECQGRTLYHMSTTYKPYGNREYGEKDVNAFFKTFYIQKFLPYIMGTKNYHTNRMKSIQPITYCFVDEHEPKAVKTYNSYTFPARLHHHAILALDEQTVDKMKSLEYENSLAGGGFTHKIMTSYIRECEAQTVLYASKMLRTYPEFMLFPKLFKEAPLLK